MKILNFGSCNIDYVYSLNHIVAPGETETTHKLQVFPGGKGLNQSVALAKAGARVYHAGCVGADGDMLLKVLSENGVDVSYIKNVDAKNGHAIIQVSNDGSNSIFLYPGSNEMISADFVDEVLENFTDGDIILLQNEINDVDYIIKKAYQKKMCIVFNPSPFNEKIKDIDLDMISYILVNEVEARDISGCEEPRESLVYFKQKHPELKVILTLGESGSIYMDKENELYQPAYCVDVVDTTAAGDTFTGYFVSEISRGESFRDALMLAAAASAIAVSKNGASPSIPRRDEVIERADKLSVKTNNNDLSKKTDKYIEDNLQTANLAELAKLLGYSEVYTGSLVKRVKGMTFSKLLREKRCRAAAQLLEETDLSVGEIINKVGYVNESFFRKAFKEKFGKNPLDYRKEK